MEMTHASGSLSVAPGVMGAALVSKAGIALAAAVGAEGVTLSDLPTGAFARVISVAAPEVDGSLELARRLAELGFLPGERLRIVARGLLGREPIAVRIGTGTFALRMFEAAYIRVSPEHSQRA